MGAGGLAPLKIHAPLDGGTVHTGDGRVNDAGFRKFSFGNGQIFPVDLPVFHHFRQGFQAFLLLYGQITGQIERQVKPGQPRA